MERGSDKHNPRIDEELETEVQALVKGEPTDSRVEEFRQTEGPAVLDPDEDEADTYEGDGDDVGTAPGEPDEQPEATPPPS